MKLTTWVSIFAFGIGLSACGLNLSEPKKEDKRESTQQDGLVANGTLEDDGFSLTLPEIPGGVFYKAHLRIYYGSNSYKLPACEYAQPIGILNDSDVVEDGDGGSAESVSLPEIAYKESRPYVSGDKIGPIELKNNSYTAHLDLYSSDTSRPNFQGVGSFVVSNGLVSLVKLEMIQVKKCEDPVGGVVIDPVFSDTKPPPGPTQLHAFGIYESRGDHSYMNHPMGQNVIYIKGSGSVVVAVASYEPTEWIIKTEAGVVVERVIAYGYHQQKVVAGNAKVDINCYDGCDNRDYAYFYKHPSAESDKFFKKIAEKTGLKPSSVQSAYQSKSFTLQLN